MSKAPNAIRVVKKEQKESQLTHFIKERLDTEGLRTNKTGYCQIIARSPSSPVVQAAVSMGDDLAKAGIIVQLILASDQSDDETAATPAMDMLSHVGSCKKLNDTRLLDAHEQLVMDHSSAWIGDSMRRDPLKTDAFENYAKDNDDVVKWALSSFAELWRLAAPMKFACTDGSCDEIAAPHFLNAQGQGKSDSEKLNIGTRH